MFDFRPAAYVIGLLSLALGCTMVFPMLIDIFDGSPEWWVFGLSGVLTALAGGSLALACANSSTGGLSIQQTFILTTGVWVVLPVFGALPFWFGATDARLVDGFFEAMSALTTTGSTVFEGLGDLPRGILLWRGMMQWFGGIGIIVVAMVFLPMLRVGGMQIFRSEGFETMGKILPKAAEIARQIGVIYVVLTVVCFACYLAVGMSGFDALVHAFTTLSTGGFSTEDASFGAFQGPAEYVATVFMMLASLPFVRYVQLVAGTAVPLYRDSQIRAFLILFALLVVVLTIYQLVHNHDDLERSVRESLFNVASIISGTGYASVNYQAWGHFPMMLFFMMGLVGGCAGSTCCSIKVFRYELLVKAIIVQIKRLHNPHGVFVLKYNRRSVPDEVISSVMAFFMLFLTSLAVLSVALGMTGLDKVTAISGAATALANVGPGLGDYIGPSGNFSELNDIAKWLLAIGMLVGRLELMAVFVLFTANFWRN
ncbi:MAG: TrkH family potassium uptake protein [Rhodobacteraceae bacterium]|nr:TrkH family potassium uptake protein [Paracoccaceae bacterium]